MENQHLAICHTERAVIRSRRQNSGGLLRGQTWSARQNDWLAGGGGTGPESSPSRPRGQVWKGHQNGWSSFRHHWRVIRLHQWHMSGGTASRGGRAHPHQVWLWHKKEIVCNSRGRSVGMLILKAWNDFGIKNRNLMDSKRSDEEIFRWKKIL